MLLKATENSEVSLAYDTRAKSLGVSCTISIILVGAGGNCPAGTRYYQN
jgi:hypothetical protein